MADDQKYVLYHDVYLRPVPEKDAEQFAADHNGTVYDTEDAAVQALYKEDTEEQEPEPAPVVTTEPTVETTPSPETTPEAQQANALDPGTPTT